MKLRLPQNDSAKHILVNTLASFLSLFVNGFGVYLTIRAGIGSGPWDVFHIGLANTLHVLYGTASIGTSCCILLIDILMKEPIGISMIVDALTVGKTVDLFNYLDLVPTPKTLAGSILLLLTGLTIMGTTQYYYMLSSLGCGPRDTLLVGLKKRLKRIPIGAVSVMILSSATLVGYFLGGPVGIGTLICAFCSGPIMQTVFRIAHFDAATVHHQSIGASLKLIFGKDKAHV